MLCSFHAASGVVRATQERERRDRAQAVPLKLPFTTLYQDDVGTAKIHRTNYALHLLHEGGGVRLEGIRGSVYDVWLGQKQFKARQSIKRQIQVYLAAFQPNTGTRYDVRLANLRAPGVWFLLGFSVYLFLAQNGPDVPVFGQNPCFFQQLFGSS